MCDMGCERTQLQDDTPKVSDTVKVRKQWKQSQNTINKVAKQQKWFTLTKIVVYTMHDTGVGLLWAQVTQCHVSRLRMIMMVMEVVTCVSYLQLKVTDQQK